MLIIFCAEIEEAKHIECPGAKIIITGPGLANVITTPTLNLRPGDKVINVGYAGSTKYNVGDIISVGCCERFNSSYTIDEPVISLVPCYRSDKCYTADNFIKEVTIELPLVDMELYYLASIYPNIEAIKIVSDNLNYKEYKEFDFDSRWEYVNRILRNL